MSAPTGPAGAAGQESERVGHPLRRFPVAVSAGTMALAWARQENAPAGAAVVVDNEISPMGRRSNLWRRPPETTLALAVVVRPKVAPEEGDVTWLLAGLAVAGGAQQVTGTKLATWWPDGVVDAETGDPVASTKAEVQLAPGQVRVAVATVRVDLAQLGLGAGQRDELIDAVLQAFDRESEAVAEEGTAVAAAGYSSRCAMLGRRVKVTLLPRGEARGTVRNVDRLARLELESPTGMIERVTIDQLKSLEVV